MKYVKYPVGSVCKILNITQGGIRFYEQKGIIKSRREEDNNYRFYTFRDLHTIMTIREYRSLGFGLEEAGNLVNMPTVNDIANEISIQINNCENEIREKINILNKLKDKLTEINNIEKLINKFYYKERKALYRLSCQNGDKVIKCKESQNILKEWGNKSYMVRGCPCIPLERIKDKFPAEVGVCIYENELDFNLNENDYIKYYKKETCLCTVLMVTDNDLFIRGFYKLLAPVLTYMKDNNLVLIGDIMGTKLVTTNDEGQVDYYEVYLPVKFENINI